MRRAFIGTSVAIAVTHAWWLTRPESTHTTVPYLPVAAAVVLLAALVVATRQLPPAGALDDVSAFVTAVGLFLVVQPPGLPDLRPAAFLVVIASGAGALVLAWRLGRSAWQRSARAAASFALGLGCVAVELPLQGLRAHLSYYDTHGPGLASLASWSTELAIVLLVAATLIACGGTVGAVAGRTTTQ